MKKIAILLFASLSLIILMFCAGCAKSNDAVITETRQTDAHRFDLFLNDKEKTLEGKQQILYHLPDNNLDKIIFQLHANAYKEIAVCDDEIEAAYPSGISFGGIEIRTVTIDGTEVVPCFEGKNSTLMELTLPQKKSFNDEIEIFLEWQITIPNIRHRLGFYDGVYNLGNFYPTPCVYQSGYIINDFYILGDPYCSEVADFEFSFDIPNKYTLACGGATGNITPGENGRKNVDFKCQNLRDAGFVISDKFVMRSADSDGVKIMYYYINDKKPIETLNHTKQVFDCFQKTFGKYPYQVYSVVQTPFAFGGMEYSGLCFVAPQDNQNDYFRTIVHETAHQWWYSKVGNDQIGESWLDESLAEFSTLCFYKQYKEKDYKEMVEKAYDDYIFYSGITGRTGEGAEIENALKNFNRYSYYYNVYVKGALMFDSLYKIKGESFISALAQYCDKYSLKLSSKNDLISSLEKSLNCRLDDYFDPWLSGKVLLCRY